MKVGLVTSISPSHAWFVGELAKRDLLDGIVIVSEPQRPEWAGADPHPIDAWSRFHAAAGDGVNFRDWDWLGTCDVVIVYGGGIIPAEKILPGPHWVTLHGGDPFKYRGLDSHLWALYHRDYEAIRVSLLELDAKVDAGGVIATQALSKPESIDELRAATARACLQLVTIYLAHSDPSWHGDRPNGRYYSHMPACLKDVAAKHLDEWPA